MVGRERLLSKAPDGGLGPSTESVPTSLDSDLLSSFERRLQVIRDRVRGVANGYHTGVYLTGRSGTLKTHTVSKELQQISTPSVIRNARMTPVGLFDFLGEHPEHLIVLDDIPSLVKQDAALPILMAALDGEPKSPRTVTYKSRDRDEEISFSGSIVFISNLALANDPLANALRSRVVVLEHDPTDQELAAFVRMSARSGYKGLTSEQCQEVVTYVLSVSRLFGRRLDLRDITKAYEDRRQWEHRHSETPWQELVRTTAQQLPREPLRSKKDDIECQRKSVAEAISRFPNDVVRQMEFSGLRKSTFYKRRRELDGAASVVSSFPDFHDVSPK